MKAVRYHDFGGPSVSSVDEIEPLTPREQEVSIDVRGIGINPSDILRRTGAFRNELPLIPGKDVAGIVTGTGDDVDRFEPGDRVFGYIPHSNVPGSGTDRQGTYAENVVALTDRLAHLPLPVSFESGAAIPAVAVTAWEALVRYGGLQPSETCLIHGGSGGVGHVAVQLASTMGANVVATAGDREKRQRVSELGADRVLDYSRPDLADGILEECSNRPAVILDHRVGDYLQLDVDVIDQHGTIAIIGGYEDSPRIDISTALLKNVTIVPYTVSLTRNIGTILERIAALLRENRLSVDVWKTFQLKEVADAQRTVSNESFVGKVVMVP
ncbi:NADPH:quinone reductase [Halosolutus amylolyticus]|uniref:NADPH:quinone reductase n=2 Tax=Halosolutus amylolyticus TaxID=2932267 RepID=A0ABD5PIF1_9EURY